MKHTKLYMLLAALVLLAILAACAPPPTPEKVVETITIVETVVVQGEPVIQEKIITATPEPTKPPMDKVTLRLNWSFYGIHAAFIYGAEQGCYEKENIDLTVKQGNGSSNAVKLVANKDSDFAYASNGALISNMVQGAPVKAVMSVDAMGTDAVLCRPDSGVKTFADLKGKTIMTTAGAGVNDYFPVALAYNNMTLDDVKLTNVAESALVTSYLQNLAPCILAGIDDKPAQIEKEGGDPPVILTYADNGVAQPGYVIVAHQDTIAQNPDLVQRFVNGSLCSIRACLDDRDACTQALVDYNSQLADSADMVRKQLDVSLDILYSPNNKDKILGLNVPEDWENVLELKKKYQELQTDMTADQFYTNEFLPK